MAADAGEAGGPDEASGTDEWDEPGDPDEQDTGFDDGFTCGNCRRGRCARCKDKSCSCCAGGDPDPWP